MAFAVINEQYLSDIGDAIRSKLSETDLYYPSEMASKIMDISGGGGGDSDIDALIARTISGEYVNSTVNIIGSNAFRLCDQLSAVEFTNVTRIKSEAFRYCHNLMSISFPLCVSASDYAFGECSNLTFVNIPLLSEIPHGAFTGCLLLSSVDFPQASYMNNMAFYSCLSLVNVSIPRVENIGSSAFNNCRSLKSLSLPSVVNIYANAFFNCVLLTDIYLMNSSLAALRGSNAFSYTPIAGYTATAGEYGRIHVPASLYDQYIVASNWSYFSSRFVSE